MSHLENAKRLAATDGAKKFWHVREIDGRHYVEADRMAQCSVAKPRSRIVTDDHAIERARKAGVICADDGLIDAA